MDKQDSPKKRQPSRAKGTAGRDESRGQPADPPAVSGMGGTIADPSPQAPGLITSDASNGVMAFNPTSTRIISISANAWVGLEVTIFTNLMKGAAPLVFEMGRAYGAGVARDLAALRMAPSQLNEHIEGMFSSTGWGVVSISGDLKGGRKIVLTTRNCPFCAPHVPKTKERNSCYFLMGLSKGLIDLLYDSPHTVRETRCGLRGDDVCELILEEKRSEEERAWAMNVYFPSLYPWTPGA